MWRMPMGYVAVSSSTIAAIAYDGVGTESKGRYFGEFVRNAYACAKVRSGRARVR